MRFYISDILAAMVAAQEFINGMDFNTFLEDDKTNSAVIRKLENIEEASVLIQQNI